MQYISGKFALNIADDKLNCDWHQSTLDWSNPCIHDSSQYPFEDWGIIVKYIPEMKAEMPVASHARACLDMLFDGKYGSAGGMREYYINGSTPVKYVFQQVVKMRVCPNWPRIDAFMKKEYKLCWRDFKRMKGIS